MHVDTDDVVSRDRAYYVWIEIIGRLCYDKFGKRIKPYKLHYDWRCYTVFRRWHNKHKKYPHHVFTHCLAGTNGKTITPKTCGFFPRPINNIIRRHARGWDSREVCIMKARGWLAANVEGAERKHLEKELERI